MMILLCREKFSSTSVLQMWMLTLTTMLMTFMLLFVHLHPQVTVPIECLQGMAKLQQLLYGSGFLVLPAIMALTVPHTVLVKMILMVIISVGVMEKWSVGVDGLDQLQIAEHVSTKSLILNSDV